MFKKKEALSQIEKPKEAKTTALETEIFVMPKEFQGVQENVVAVAPVSPQPKKPIIEKKQRLSKGRKTLLFLGGGLLLVLVIVAVFISLFPQIQTALYQKPSSTPSVNNQIQQESSTTIPVPVSPPIKEIEPITQNPFDQEPIPAKDTDRDGLTDTEETLYGTNIRLPDTDADGFLDGNEVFHGYHPNGTAPKTLLQAGFVSRSTLENQYELFYPTAWKEKKTSEQAFSFVATTGEIILLFLEEKDPEMVSLEQWFVAQDNTRKDIQSFLTKTGYPSVMTDDKQVVSVDLGKNILTWKYQTLSKHTMEYLLTFQMMINSVVSLESSAEEVSP